MHSWQKCILGNNSDGYCVYVSFHRPERCVFSYSISIQMRFFTNLQNSQSGAFIFGSLVLMNAKWPKLNAFYVRSLELFHWSLYCTCILHHGFIKRDLLEKAHIICLGLLFKHLKRGILVVCAGYNCPQYITQLNSQYVIPISCNKIQPLPAMSKFTPCVLNNLHV